MLKAFIVGADSVTPDIIFRKKELFPTLAKMIDSGTCASYSAYTQKGFCGSYSSEQNWASLYTGLEPKEHQINTYFSRGEARRPRMSDFDELFPFWKVLNNHGYRVGLFAADNCACPVEIDGYAVSTSYKVIETPSENRIAPRMLEICEKDRTFVLSIMEDAPTYRLYPKTLHQQGYTFEQLKADVDLAEKVIETYHFQDAIDNFRQELEYWFTAMKKAQRLNPVEVMYFYTPSPDLIAHCCMYCDDNDVLLETYRLIDEFMGDFIAEFSPEISIFLSDHGQQNFKDLIACSDKEVQKEAFAAKDDVIWLKNGYIAFEAFNGALLFTAHALKGTFIASGKGIKKNYRINEMRTVDFCPTLLEMLQVEVPFSRSGYVLELFDRPLINKNRVLKEEEIKYKSIALIQTGEVNFTDIFINELYIKERFSKITLVGNERYKEIFLNNPRIAGFVSYEEYSEELFDEVYCCIHNKTTNEMRHMRVK